MGMILDTCFVIAAEREGRKHSDGDAIRFLTTHPLERFHITFTISGELACGNSANARKYWDLLCKPFHILQWNREISWTYGNIHRDLSDSGNLIGTNDMWIAATALVYDMDLVTRNLKDFHRVKNLRVVEF